MVVCEVVEVFDGWLFFEFGCQSQIFVLEVFEISVVCCDKVIGLVFEWYSYDTGQQLGCFFDGFYSFGGEEVDEVIDNEHFYGFEGDVVGCSVLLVQEYSYFLIVFVFDKGIENQLVNGGFCDAVVSDIASCEREEVQEIVESGETVFLVVDEDCFGDGFGLFEKSIDHCFEEVQCSFLIEQEMLPCDFVGVGGDCGVDLLYCYVFSESVQALHSFDEFDEFIFVGLIDYKVFCEFEE